MTLRDDLIPTVDAARGLLADLGLRRYTVLVCVVTPGVGAWDDPTETQVELEPAPRVRLSRRHMAQVPGIFQDGDATVDRISATYERSDLEGADKVWRIGEVGTDPDDMETFFAVKVDWKNNFGWEVTLRRRLDGVAPAP